VLIVDDHPVVRAGLRLLIDAEEGMELLHEQPETKILVLSMQDDPRCVREAFGAGASGYVLKDAVDTEVVTAIREVARGGRYVNPDLGARLVAADTDAARQAAEDPLSEREHGVLRLLALGFTPRRARALCDRARAARGPGRGRRLILPAAHDRERAGRVVRALLPDRPEQQRREAAETA
jgi:DNA-binding NarL/FixJ family response regulator